MENKKKIRVLMVPSDTAGVGHFRNIWPAQAIEKNHKDEVEVVVNNRPDFNNIEYFKSFDIVHFHRHIGPYEGSVDLFPRIQEGGTILIMDIDDFWEPPSTHPLYELVKQDNLSEKITTNLKLVDYVTTTTSIFADYISEFNPNVHVIPNAINMEHKMWSGEAAENKGDKCRIAWIGGSSHLYDIELMRPGFNQLWSSSELKDKFQIVMCGFDTRGTITEVNQKGERRTRPILPHETVWKKFEDVFTSKYKGRSDDEDYFKWLDKNVKPKSSDYADAQYEKNYVRRWTLPLTKYGTHYDYADVCLAPLTDTFIEKIRHPKPDGSARIQEIKRNHVFNEVKSELKIIEAGMKRKVLIAQDFGIYSKLIEDGKNGLLVKNDSKDWYKHMKKVIKDPEYREELANNLHEFVKDKYHIDKVTADRVELYKTLIKNKK